MLPEFHRYAGKVKYWIIVNQINLIVHESFNHLGVAEDVVEDVLSARRSTSLKKYSIWLWRRVANISSGLLLAG